MSRPKSADDQLTAKTLPVLLPMRLGAHLALLNFTQPPLEESALALIRNQRQRPPVALRRLRRGPDAAQQIGARGMQQVIAVEIACERVNQRERQLRTVNHRHRHGRFNDTNDPVRGVACISCNQAGVALSLICDGESLQKC
jgi:hypothetical protein